MSFDLHDFVNESNHIEGIYRDATPGEIAAHVSFLALVKPTVADMQTLVGVIQPNAVLREYNGQNVRVGSYYPPRGGPDIRKKLGHLLLTIGEHTPYSAHCAYEALHPFTDGNGRSGRALWLWMMKGHAPLRFLHQFYYQTLSASAR